MKINEILTTNGRKFAICSGKDIKYGFQCKKIQIQGTALKILNCYVQESATAGIMVAYLTLEDDAPVLTGEFDVIE